MSIIQPAQKFINHFRLFLKEKFKPHAPIVSSNYALLEKMEISGLEGWQMLSVAERQHKAFIPLLQATREGEVRRDFRVAAQSVKTTGMINPLIVEIGCGSGYYSEVLSQLLGMSIRYVGLDYAKSMTSLAHHKYPTIPFLTGDACHLPLKTASCDILFNGTSLMHISNYSQAIAESVRVSKKWCIFHTVPLTASRSTTFLCKRAYGEPVIEVIFNQEELEKLFSQYGLAIQKKFKSIPYDVSAIIGEHTWTLTYLCKKVHE